MHEKGLEDALGVVEGPVGESQLLHLRLRRDARRAASPDAARALRGGPRVHELGEEVDERVDQGRAKVLPEEHGGVADLRAQVLEGELGAVADAEIGELLSSRGEGDWLALSRLQREGEALPGGVELGLGRGEGGLEVVDGGLEWRERRERERRMKESEREVVEELRSRKREIKKSGAR